ncbi:MAG: cardiolipin synthase [Bacteroides sp.]|nr:cardiolipin synthase [Bacteroides sp.]MBD5358730.1 cardiolipin synthase [Bacteroides sp.]
MIVSSVVVVLKENRNPIRALSWVVALIFLPGVGLVFYLFFGRSLKGLTMISRHNKRKLMHRHTPKRVDIAELELDNGIRNLVKLAHNLSGGPLTVNNEIDIFTDGLSKFDSLKSDLKNARKSILLQYYIFLDDSIGNEVADILIDRAQNGVAVKVIYDHVGSFSAKKSFFKRMEAAGVETHPFFRVNFPQLANRINWRNHRKIVVIDGEIGYIGGMNVADRYIDGLQNGDVWRDTHFRVKGDIVESLLYSFAIDWNFLKKKQYIPHIEPVHGVTRNSTGVQLVTSGPIDRWNNLSLVFLKAILSARKSVYIQTPYFLPTDALMNALQAAALSKIDVRIMMPEKTDSALLHYASFSYVTQCLKAGIKVYLYTPGMLHAKAMIIDDTLVTAGSTNFDFRSFENNFECNLLIYDAPINAKMREIFFDDLKRCRKVTLEQWRKRPLSQRLLESLLRPISPLL